MSRQFRILLLEEDIAKLEDHLVHAHNCCFLVDTSKTKSGDRLLSLRRTLEGEAIYFAVIANRAETTDAIYRFVETQKHWAIDIQRSNVIEFFGCHRNKKGLNIGRLYYTTGYHGEDGEWIEKPPEFIRWAERVFRNSKKLFTYCKKYQAYVGDAAAEWFRQGGMVRPLGR